MSRHNDDDVRRVPNTTHTFTANVVETVRLKQ